MKRRRREAFTLLTERFLKNGVVSLYHLIFLFIPQFHPFIHWHDLSSRRYG